MKTMPGGTYIMNHLNCWEFMKCGKELGGDNADKSGVCPIATDLFLANSTISHGKEQLYL